VPKSRLDSWKSIAEYLERSPRTVQRWHAFHGLPIHHFGGQKGSVFAYAEDIDRWLIGLAEETRIADVDACDASEARKTRSQELTSSAQEMWETRSEGNLSTIAGLYRNAIDLNPANGAAFTGLANSMISAALQGVMDGSLAYPCAAEALRRAAQLESRQTVDAQCAAAWLNMVYERKWRLARANFEEVLGRQPRNGFALAGLALLQIAEGDPSAGCKWAWEAWKQNTLVCALGSLVCWSIYLSGDFDQALELVAQVRSSGASGALLAAIEALALIQTGEGGLDQRRIEALAMEFPQSQILQGTLGYAYGVWGQMDKAWAIYRNLEQMKAQKKRNNAYGLALVLLGLGRGQDAVEWLEAAYAEGALWSLGFRSDPLLGTLGGDPRYEMLLRKIGATTGMLAQSIPVLEFAAAGM
jgi:tetratricopeptide (TPR) repeat protein